MSDDGLVTVPSAYDPGETLERLLQAVSAAGMTVFAQIDHAKAAADVGLDLRPTQLVVFGSPKGGTPLMQDRQTAGIDLPLKALVWQDVDGAVWLTYNDVGWLATRHGLGEPSAQAVEAIGGGLQRLAGKATV